MREWQCRVGRGRAPLLGVALLASAAGKRADLVILDRTDGKTIYRRAVQ